jgi:AmmeMemoRadiSam system protein B/AmmeMemoRadiSam system protein A
MNTIRQAAVAGSFYPANGDDLERSVDALLAANQSTLSNNREAIPKVIIAPHAGHIYSGQIAASAYSRLRHAQPPITRVVLLGPSHRLGFKGIAATSVTAYQTPLGNIPIDSSSIQEILMLPGTGFLDEAHKLEHSIEVHLPFLQRVLESFTLVPLVIGDANKEDVARVLGTLWGGPETLIIVSSDLSHFHPYAEAQQLDSNTSAKIVALDASLSGEEACGCRPLNGLLHLLKAKNLTIEQLMVKNSGDTAGDLDRVVGYGTYIVVDLPALELPLCSRQQLLQQARNAILYKLTTNTDGFSIRIDDFSQQLQQDRACFITLNIEGRLRGCIGSLESHRPLIIDVIRNAEAAAFEDPRFPPLSLDEYQQVDIHISVLSKPEPMKVSSRQDLLSRLRSGVDGLIIQEGNKRATFLPAVWEQLPDPETFLTELRKKARLEAKGWSEQTIVHRYSSEEFS